MARKKKELTRVQAAGRPKWRKMRDGKNYYFRGTYDEALSLWHAKLAELLREEVPTDDEYYKQQFDKMRRWFIQNGMPDEAQGIPNEDYRLHWRGLTAEGRTLWLERFKQMEQPQPDKPTVGQAAEMFFARQQAKLAVGKIGAAYYNCLKRYVDHFADHVGRRATIAGVNGATLESYHTLLLGKIANKEWEPEYAASYMRGATTFTWWAFRGNLIEEFPRKLGSKDLAIECPAKKIETFTKEEIHILLGEACERTKMFMLLMLNTGMTQQDIADVLPEEINCTDKRITRKRSKTKTSANTPEVSYPLWASTFELVQKFCNPTGPRAFLNEKGGTLITSEMKDGKLRSIDNVAVAYKRLTRRLKTREDNPVTISKSLKIFRKTAPSMMQKNPLYASCARYFLGHSPRGVADRFYVTPDQTTFDAAVQWLGQELGIEEDLSI